MIRLVNRATTSSNILRLRLVPNRLNHFSRHFSSANPQDDAKVEVKGVPYSELTVGIPKETFDLEKRVAATPEVSFIYYDYSFVHFHLDPESC